MRSAGVAAIGVSGGDGEAVEDGRSVRRCGVDDVITVLRVAARAVVTVEVTAQNRDVCGRIALIPFRLVSGEPTVHFDAVF